MTQRPARAGSLRAHLETADANLRKLISTEDGGANFTMFAEEPPKHHKELNNWIKDKIRLYVETWILPEVEEALKKVTK